MNDIVLLILTWLPVGTESVLLIFVVRFIAKKIKEHFSIPTELLSEIKKQREESVKLNNKLAILSDENGELRKELYRLRLESKGIKVNESVKKN